MAPIITFFSCINALDKRIKDAKPPNVKFEVPERVKERMNEGFEELQDRFKEKLALDKFTEMMKPHPGNPADLNFQVNIPVEELQRGARVPEHNVPPPQRPNR